MRKIISTYNHKKFAQKAPGTNPPVKKTTPPAKGPAKGPVNRPVKRTNFKDPANINKIISNSNTGEAAKQLIFLAAKSVIGEEQYIKIPKEQYDKTVYTDSNIKKYIEFFESLRTVPGVKIDLLNKVQTEFTSILSNKYAENLRTNQNSSITVPVRPADPNANPAMIPAAEAARQQQVTPEQAESYLQNVIPALTALSKDKSKPRAFTQRYSNEYNDVLFAMNILRQDPKYFEKLEGFNKEFKVLSPLFNDAMHPQGWTAAGNSIFVHDDRYTGDLIINDIKSLKNNELKPEERQAIIQNIINRIKVFQSEFLDKNQGNTDVAEVANKVNKFIDLVNNSRYLEGAGNAPVSKTVDTSKASADNDAASPDYNHQTWLATSGSGITGSGAGAGGGISSVNTLSGPYSTPADVKAPAPSLPPAKFKLPRLR